MRHNVAYKLPRATIRLGSAVSAECSPACAPLPAERIRHSVAEVQLIVTGETLMAGESGSVSHDLPSPTLAGSDDTHSTTVVLRALLEPDFSAILRRSNGWHPYIASQTAGRGGGEGVGGGGGRSICHCAVASCAFFSPRL